VTKFSGGCLCGQVRYEVTGDPVRVVNCHCDDCRRVTGAAFATNVFVNADELKITQGEPRAFEHVSDSGKKRNKEFCPNCGSQLFSYTIGSPLKSLKVGSVDDARFLKPTANLYWSRVLPCAHLSDDLINHDEMPKK
jgi:hypothetical protein